jgi:hypothetical protein
MGLRFNAKKFPPLTVPELLRDKSLLPLIEEAVHKGAVKRYPASSPCLQSRVFAVSKSDGSQRMVIDLTKVNKYLPDLHYKLPSDVSLRTLLTPNAWVAKVDIKDAYFHVPLHKSVSKFLAFSAGGKRFAFCALPFGLNIAPAVFTGMMNYPRRIVAAQGVLSLTYLDDWIIWAPTEAECSSFVQIVVTTLEDVGFIVNEEKSSLTPAQHIEWLGVAWHTPTATCSLPPQFQHKVFQSASLLLSRETYSRRQLESFIGLISFAARVVPDLAQRKHPLLYQLRQTDTDDRDRPNPSSPALKQAIRTWRNRSLLSQVAPWTLPAPSFTVWTDASAYGWGAHTISDYVQGVWSPQHAELHVNQLEIMAIRNAIATDLVQEGSSVKIVTDSSTACGVLRKKGSATSQPIMQLFSEIADICHQKSLTLTPVHLQGSLNTVADHLSRATLNPEHWELHPLDFERLCQWAGTPDVDLMATAANAKVPRFVSRFNESTATAIDAFSLHWNLWGNIYIFPPVHLLPKVVAKIAASRPRGIVIAPSNRSLSAVRALFYLASDHLQLAHPVGMRVNHLWMNNSEPALRSWTAFRF